MPKQKNGAERDLTAGAAARSIIADLPVVDVSGWSDSDMALHVEATRGLNASGIQNDLAGALAARELRARIEAAAAEVNRRRVSKAPRIAARRNRERLRTELIEQMLPALAVGAGTFSELHRRVQGQWEEKCLTKGLGLPPDDKAGVGLLNVTKIAKRLGLDLHQTE